FPDTRVGETTLYNQTLVTMQNLGSGINAGAHLTSATLTGDFSQTNNCPGPTTLLAGGASCTYTVIFTPTALGTRTGTLTITTDAPGSPSFTVKLQGNGVAIPAPTLAHSTLHFGPIVPGTSSGAQTLTLNNSGNGPLTFTAPVLTGPFSVSASTCASPLAGGSSCTFSIKFNPSLSGSGSGTL